MNRLGAWAEVNPRPGFCLARTCCPRRVIYDLHGPRFALMSVFACRLPTRLQSFSAYLLYTLQRRTSTLRVGDGCPMTAFFKRTPLDVPNRIVTEQPLQLLLYFTDMAELSSVPEAHLARIVRLVATIDFLCELQPGHVAHTPLSAPFVTTPSLLDAAIFSTNFAAPAALHMTPMRGQFADSDRPTGRAWNLAINMRKPFHDVCGDRPKLNRQ